MKDFFNFSALKTTYKKELIGALSSFSAMVYIIIVHPTILAEAGLPFGSIMTVTILVTAISSFLMGILGKIPLAVAPALGVSAYFSFTLIQKNHLPLSYGLFIVFLAATCILVMNFLGLRKKILDEIPEELASGITGGIGLFLIMVGLKQINLIKVGSLGLIVFNRFDTPIVLLTLFGVLLIYLFEKLKIESAFILSILINWAIAIIIGYATLKGIVAMPPSFSSTLFLLSAPSYFSFDLVKGFLSIFLVTLFDSSAGLLTLRKLLPKEAKNFNLQRALYPDAIGSFFGSLLGTSSMAIHIESLAGVQAGAKSGLTACLIGLLFLSCLFFYPLASSIPAFASAPVIIAIGVLMAKQLKVLELQSPIKKIAPILTAIMMPLTLSLYQGFKIGFITLGILSLLQPKKIKRSKMIFIFFVLFVFEQGFELLSDYF
jgi:AGZA family xanthine/uracil permease-like MFS transporter